MAGGRGCNLFVIDRLFDEHLRFEFYAQVARWVSIMITENKSGELLSLFFFLSILFSLARFAFAPCVCPFAGILAKGLDGVQKEARLVASLIVSRWWYL